MEWSTGRLVGKLSDLFLKSVEYFYGMMEWSTGRLIGKLPDVSLKSIECLRAKSVRTLL